MRGTLRLTLEIVDGKLECEVSTKHQPAAVPSNPLSGPTIDIDDHMVADIAKAVAPVLTAYYEDQQRR